MRITALAFAAALVAFVSSAEAFASPPVIDGQFALDTLDGRSVTKADYRGKWLLVYFGYTSCPDVCPATLTELGEALKELGPAAKRVQALFVTVDPVRDTVPVLRRYLKAFDPRIAGLRGDGDATEAAAKSFHVYYRARSIGNGQYAIDHSSYIYVFNPKGRFVQLLAPDSPGHRIADDVKKLVR
ncbi:MAG: SCO family protein [Rhizomicrobium sp.]